MDTVYDWITVSLFAGLIVLFLQRSMSDSADEHHDSIFLYIGAGLGCAVANYFGNQGMHVIAIPLIVATIGFILYFLRPFPLTPGR